MAFDAGGSNTNAGAALAATIESDPSPDTLTAEALSMAQHSLTEFVRATSQKDEQRRRFEIESPHLLEVNLDGRVWAKTGSMIGYVGQIKFTREGLLEQGVDKALKKMFTGEGAKFMKADGRGRLYLADSGKKVRVLELAGETMFVNGNDLLAIEETIRWEIKMMRSVAGVLAAGLFNVRISGTGLIALTTHFEPLTLRVTPDEPVFTDPNATVAWSGSLEPEIVTDISIGTFFGRGSGESIQMKFRGDGWVVLQPYEEVVGQRGR
jgi:uncharacterized protein (AIM24 family)